MEKVLHQRQKLIEHDEKQHVDTALCKGQISSILRELKEFAQSEKTALEAISELKEHFGEKENLLIATLQNNLGLTYKKQKKYQEGE